MNQLKIIKLPPEPKPTIHKNSTKRIAKIIRVALGMRAMPLRASPTKASSFLKVRQHHRMMRTLMQLLMTLPSFSRRAKLRLHHRHRATPASNTMTKAMTFSIFTPAVLNSISSCISMTPMKATAAVNTSKGRRSVKPGCISSMPLLWPAADMRKTKQHRASRAKAIIAPSIRFL